MSRHGFGAGMRAVTREMARAERARQQNAARQLAADARALRHADRQSKADAKEAARQYLAERQEDAEEQSRAVTDRERAIDGLLVAALASNPAVDLLANRKTFSPARFDESKWTVAKPVPHDFEVPHPGFFARILPGSSGRHARKVTDANLQLENAEAAHLKDRDLRQAALEAFKAAEDARRTDVDRHNADVADAHRALASGDHEAVITYFKLVLERGLRGEPDATSAEVGYSPDSKHLVVDLELPDFPTIPEESGFRYVKSGDRIESVIRPLAKRKAQYSHLLSQVALKCVDTIFRSSPAGVVECLTLNGMLETVDPATGQDVRVCLVSVRVTADTFRSLNLGQVQPEHCLRSMKASVSRSPTELLAVKPLVELDMVDPRFIETMDVLSGIDHRTNLMELTPTEFEGLITNLFATMGLDTRQTQASRDGGVDCVAFDSRPVFGGKVVIQAKRYKNTVGVSAVRDLFGTVQNEGASKGILVTTSGYGKAAYDFARGKPLELLDGPNLLHLLSEHAGIDARIVMPEAWTDLPIHGE